MSSSFLNVSLFSAQLKLKNDTEGRHALLKADGKYELDTIARGSLKSAADTEFEARNERFNFNLNPKQQTKEDGVGTISYVDNVRFSNEASLLS